MNKIESKRTTTVKAMSRNTTKETKQKIQE